MLTGSSLTEMVGIKHQLLEENVMPQCPVGYVNSIKNETPERLRNLYGGFLKLSKLPDSPTNRANVQHSKAKMAEMERVFGKEFLCGSSPIVKEPDDKTNINVGTTGHVDHSQLPRFFGGVASGNHDLWSPLFKESNEQEKEKMMELLP